MFHIWVTAKMMHILTDRHAKSLRVICVLWMRGRERGGGGCGEEGSDADAAPWKGGSAYITVQQLLTASLSLCSDRHIWSHSLGCRPADACGGPRTRRGQQTTTKSGGWEYLRERERKKTENSHIILLEPPYFHPVSPLVLFSGSQCHSLKEKQKKCTESPHAHSAGAVGINISTEKLWRAPRSLPFSSIMGGLGSQVIGPSAAENMDTNRAGLSIKPGFHTQPTKWRGGNKRPRNVWHMRLIRSVDIHTKSNTDRNQKRTKQQQQSNTGRNK